MAPSCRDQSAVDDRGRHGGRSNEPDVGLPVLKRGGDTGTVGGAADLDVDAVLLVESLLYAEVDGDLVDVSGDDSDPDGTPTLTVDIEYPDSLFS